MTAATQQEREARKAGVRTSGRAGLRMRLTIGGAVQGVGYRPFVYRVAVGLGLRGWVKNSASGVILEVEGAEEALRTLRERIEHGAPAGSHVASVEAVWLDAVGHEGFEILESETGKAGQVWVRPDVATCEACVGEILDPANRRHGYAFTNCTYCGPRYSIMESVPYDRARTTMKGFVMCAACKAEYDDPGDRRFHAQPNACPECGPQLAYWNVDGRVLGEKSEALTLAVECLKSGRVLALKGLGGFQLLVDAGSEEAVRRLRSRKHREEKPLALLFPGLEAVKQVCLATAAEVGLLRAPEAPIVLLQRRTDASGGLAESVAPGNPWLGVMLPYTPLHHLLLQALGRPVVATSGNVSDEPICIDEREALERLGSIADGYLVHDRPIARHVDDSIVRIVAGREMVMRRARGYAPLPVRVKIPLAAGVGPVLALGGQMKNAVALGSGSEIYLSQHIGDLENALALAAFGRVCADLPRLLEVAPRLVMTDLHPEYLSTKQALRMGLPCRGVQHHYAHVLACMAENELEGPVLGFAWDGTGWGPDGTIWGGESLLATLQGFRRFAALRPFPLPGGDRAVREPRRAALGMLWELKGTDLLEFADLPPVKAFGPGELEVLRSALARGVNSPRTSSMGRLFDAVAAFGGLRQRMTFEAQAAMELEWVTEHDAMRDPYLMELRRAHSSVAIAGDQLTEHQPEWWIDWEPMIRRVMEDVRAGVGPGIISARFHGCLAKLLVKLAERAGLDQVVLTGGCFQNRVLLEEGIAGLRGSGYRVYWPQRVPAGDGGIALGQAVAGMTGRGGVEDTFRAPNGWVQP
jgi:hydrogenase maturation protein HypF